jgi:hypothetical protein
LGLSQALDPKPTKNIERHADLKALGGEFIVPWREIEVFERRSFDAARHDQI